MAAADPRPQRSTGDQHEAPAEPAWLRPTPEEIAAAIDNAPTPDELPGGPAYADEWTKAERAAGREWRMATDERRIRIVTDAAITQRHLRARAITMTPGAIDAADLLALELPPLRWIVPDLLPAGTAILASPPKVGKSCLVYQAAVEVAIGGELLGRRVTPGSALYLALEDGQRRGQDRLRAALAGRTLPRGRLEVRWSARKTGAGLEDDLAAWLDTHPDAGLVAIDTLGRVRPRTDGRRNAYEVDVEDLGRLQDLFRDRDVALVIVHHARKEAGDDFLASVSGTYGVTGSADTIIAIKRKRLEAFGSILVTGRDVADAEISVRFDGMTWSASAASLGEASFERLEVYRTIAELGPIYPAGIAKRTGLGRTSIQNMVGKLVEAGAVARTTNGYVAAGSVSRAGAGDRTDSDDSDSHWSHRGHARDTVGGRMAADIVGATDEPHDLDEDLGPPVRQLFRDIPPATA